MTRPAYRIALLILVVAVLLWSAWAATGRVNRAPAGANTEALQFTALGEDRQHGNLLAVQPWLTARDYASSDTLTHKLDSYFAQARQHGWIGPRTVAVLPEYSGTWLVASGEKDSVFDAADVGSAMTTVALTHLPQFLYYLATAPAVEDRAKWALFSLKAETMATDYQAVFGSLAQRYGVHVVAGSIVLPGPSLRDGELRVRPGGALYNVSAVFGPDGRILPPLVVKAFPINEEKTFTAAGNPQDIPVFSTPAGKLAVLVCADAWYPAAYASAQQAGAQLIAVPSFSAGNNAWSAPWGGYNGAPTEKDVAPTDIGKLTEGEAWLGKLTEGEAWRKYAMVGRAPRYGMDYGVNVFLRGTLWDLGSDGSTLALQAGKTVPSALAANAVLTTLWLP